MRQPKLERARTFATNSTTQSSDIPTGSSVDDTLEKLFQRQEESNAVVDAIAQGTWDPNYYNVADLAITGINAFRDLTLLGYGGSIVGVTLMIRMVMFPLFVKLQRNSARMAHMQPELQALKKKLDALGSSADQETQMKYGLQMRALFKKYNCNPMSSLAAPLIQMPIFMGMFFGLRKMPDYFASNMSAEGMFWFSDLTLYDPYYVLPALSGATLLASVEVGKAQMMSTNPAQGKIMVNLFRGLAIVMVPAISTFPTALTLYWLVNNTFSAVQAWVFQHPPLRKALDIWELPKPMPGMPQPEGILESIRNTIHKKPSESERIKSHNEAIDRKKKVAAMMMKPPGGGGGGSMARKRFREKSK